MPEDVRSPISSSRLSATEVARHTFVTVRRGFDPTEVRAYLELVARELAGLGAARAGAAPAAGRGRGAGPPPGDRRGHPDRGPRSAERPGAPQRPRGGRPDRPRRPRRPRPRWSARPSSRPTEVQVHAESAGGRARSPRPSWHGRGRTGVPRRRPAAVARQAGRARAEGEALVARAREQGRAMIEQARRPVASVLADMAQRRRVMTVQIEQFRAARDELAASVHRRARLAWTGSSTTWSRADDAARAAAAEVAAGSRREPATTSLRRGGGGAADRDLDCRRADVRGGRRPADVGDARRRRRAAVAVPEIDEPAASPGPAEPDAVPFDVDAVEPPAPVGAGAAGSPTRRRRVAAAAGPRPTGAPRVVAGRRSRRRRTRRPTIRGRRGRALARLGRAAPRTPAGRAGAPTPARSAGERTAPTAPEPRRPGEAPAARPPTPRRAPATDGRRRRQRRPSTPATARRRRGRRCGAGRPDAGSRAGAELLDPIVAALARRLKRALQDDQNRLLDRLRRARRRLARRPAPEDEQRELYAEAAAGPPAATPPRPASPSPASWSGAARPAAGAGRQAVADAGRRPGRHVVTLLRRRLADRRRGRRRRRRRRARGCRLPGVAGRADRAAGRRLRPGGLLGRGAAGARQGGGGVHWVLGGEAPAAPTATTTRWPGTSPPARSSPPGTATRRPMPGAGAWWSRPRPERPPGLGSSRCGPPGPSATRRPRPGPGGVAGGSSAPSSSWWSCWRR